MAFKLICIFQFSYFFAFSQCINYETYHSREVKHKIGYFSKPKLVRTLGLFYPKMLIIKDSSESQYKISALVNDEKCGYYDICTLEIHHSKRCKKRNFYDIYMIKEKKNKLKIIKKDKNYGEVNQVYNFPNLKKFVLKINGGYFLFEI
jgi:hypothetical protein